MISHQNVPVDVDWVSDRGLAEYVKEQFVVLRVIEDVHTIVATLDHMLRDIRNANASQTAHNVVV